MIYVSLDHETTGPSPDNNAILQIGAVALDSTSWDTVGEFSQNLTIPSNRDWNLDTYKWWLTSPEAGEEKLALVMSNQLPAPQAIKHFFAWLRDLPTNHGVETVDTRVTFVCNPIAYDHPLLASYMREYIGKEWEEWAHANRAGYGGIDLPTLAMTVMGATDRAPAYPDARRSLWPERWSPPDLPHTHIAIDDARHQAHAFICMMKELTDLRRRWV